MMLLCLLQLLLLVHWHSSTGLILLLPSSPPRQSSSVQRLNLWRLPKDGAGGSSSLDIPRSRRSTLTAAKSRVAGFEEEDSSQFTVVVVGGGWAGFTAADALASLADASNQQNDSDNPKPAVKIHLLDASPRGPGGLAGGWRTARRQLPVEAGIHGFWREYRNTLDVMEHSIGLDLEQVLTPYTPSLLVSSSGRVALAPVLGSGTAATAATTNNQTTTMKDDFQDLFRILQQLDWRNLGAVDSKMNNFTKQLAQVLPPPLDIALLAEFDPNSPLTPTDRLSALGLLGAWADFEQEDASSWYRYDTTSADTLFRIIAAVSPTLYTELVAPLLHVLPMAPGYDLSAAAALSCFHVFALQSPGAFDVRWCRTSITEAIFNPWVTRLKETNCVDIRGSARVTSITENENKKFTVVINDEQEQIQCDAVILAVGATAAGRLIDACPPLLKLPQLKQQWKDWRGITCVTVRLFFSGNQLPNVLQQAMRLHDSTPPVTVCGPNLLPALIETGFCIYDLGRLQDANPLVQNAVEVDYFRADRLADEHSDEQIINVTLRAMEVALGLPPQSLIDDSSILLQDSAVVRARRAVSHFDVGSARRSPPIRLSRGLYTCGDWVDRTGHASWSTEKAVVTGRQAAKAVARDFYPLGGNNTAVVEVIPAASDTPTLSVLRRLARSVRSVAPANALPTAPWSSGKF